VGKARIVSARPAFADAGLPCAPRKQNAGTQAGVWNGSSVDYFSTKARSIT